MLLSCYNLKDSIKTYNGYKVCPPEETINTIKSAFSRIGLDVSYIPSNQTILRNFYPFQTGIAKLSPKNNRRMILLETHGKGVTSPLSKASSFAELIERFTGYGLAGGAIKHYLAEMKLSQIWEEKRKRNRQLETQFPYHPIENIDYIPEFYKKKYHSMAKSICYSLSRKELFCFPEEFIIKMNGSNGLASGNTLEEAILHAIFELIERLGLMFVLDNLPNCNKISKTSITNPTLKELIKTMKELNVSFELLDYSYIFNIPLIVTIFDHPQWTFSPNPYALASLGFPKMIVGVDTDPQEAAVRCFTEFIQFSMPIPLAKYYEYSIRNKFSISNLPISYKISQTFRTSTPTIVNGNPPSSVDLRNFFHRERKEISITHIRSLYDLNQKIEIEKIINILKKLDIEVLIQDITNPILQFPVVQAMLSGGKDYFSKIPLNFFLHLILDAKDKEERISLIKEKIRTNLSSNNFHKVLNEGNLFSDLNIQEFINYVIEKGIAFSSDCLKNVLWEVKINKLYFLGILYLRKKDYKLSKACFEAALVGNLSDILSLKGFE